MFNFIEAALIAYIVVNMLRTLRRDRRLWPSIWQLALTWAAVCVAIVYAYIHFFHTHPMIL